MKIKKPSPKNQAKLRALEAMQAAFPLAFPTDDKLIQPLAIGIREAVVEWAEQQRGFQVNHAISALRSYCMRFTYRRKLIAGAMRINLLGEPIEAVTEEAATIAVASIARDKAMIVEAAEKRAARVTRHQAMEEKQRAAAIAKKAKPALQPKPKKVKAAPPPAAPAAIVSKPAPAVIVKKKRTIVIPS